jgi:DNA-binding PadR family transcriptional regulator
MDSLLPSLPALLVLAALSEGPAHGYQIAQRVGERSGDVLDLKEGTLYPRLYQLERAGLVRAAWQVESGRRVRVYELTESGSAALERDRAEWRRRVQAADKVLSAVRQSAGRRPRLGDL